MEKTNGTVVDNEQNEIKVDVEIVEKEGFFKRAGKAIKKAAGAVKAHPFKTATIVAGAGAAIAGAVIVIKTIIDGKDGDSETVTIVADSLEELAEKVKDLANETDGDTVENVLEEVTDAISE